MNRNEWKRNQSAIRRERREKFFQTIGRYPTKFDRMAYVQSLVQRPDYRLLNYSVSPRATEEEIDKLLQIVRPEIINLRWRIEMLLKLEAEILEANKARLKNKR